MAEPVFTSIALTRITPSAWPFHGFGAYTDPALVAFPDPESPPIRPRIASQSRLVSLWGRVSVQTK